jgi:glycerate dehydrogenase
MKRTQIVATDGFTLNPGDNPWSDIGQLGVLTVYDRTAPAELIPRCREADLLIVNKTPVDADAVAALPRLRFIAVSATGFDCVDVEAAGRRGISVSNVPIYGTDSVAQYVFAAVLHVWHNISGHDAAVKAGEWGRQPDWSFWRTPLIELRGKTMGIVGFGRIGRRVGELAHAFGMNVMAHDAFPGADPGFAPFAWAGLEEVFGRSDVVSVHCPLTSQNQRFVNRDLLQRMKPTSLFVNASRGALVNEEDLSAALKAGRIGGAVVDVVSAEPVRPENPLLTAPHIVMTPHLAWATREARQRLMRTTAENVRAFLEGRPQNLVNGNCLGK